MWTRPLQIIAHIRRSAWTLPLAALAVLLLFGINELAHHRSVASLGSLDERDAARAQVRQVLRALIQSESGQRGHLLTRRDSFLVPYASASSAAQVSLAWLAQHYRGDDPATALVTEMTRLGMAKLSVLDVTLQLHARQGNGGWRDLMLSDIGKERMDELRSAAQSLLALETRRIEDERARVFATVRGARIGVHAVTALSLLALLWFVRQTLVVDRARRENAAALQAERDRLEAEVARRSADLAGLARHLQAAREDERGRLARELHDELGALMTSAKLDAARLKRMVGTPSPAVAQRLQHLNEAINRGVELKRRIIEDLRPSSLDTLGLVAALDILTREQAARCDARFRCELVDIELSANARIIAFRLVQAAVNNAVRQAGANEIDVALRPHDRDGRPGALVEVRDNGRGFDDSERNDFTRGLMGLRYRVEAEGGEMSVTSSPAQGTEVRAWFPLAAQPSAVDAAGERPVDGAVG